MSDELRLMRSRTGRRGVWWHGRRSSALTAGGLGTVCHCARNIRAVQMPSEQDQIVKDLISKTKSLGSVKSGLEDKIKALEKKVKTCRS